MGRKLERVLALTIAFAILLTGCGGPKTVSNATVSPSEESAKSLDSMLSSIGIIEDLSFEVNRPAAAKIEYDGTETSVEVVDARGLTWQLTIPENAIQDKCTIILTPLENIKGEHKKDGLSGILMEPDGLEFIEPATLTVTGPDADKLLFCTGTQDGKNYTYQPTEKLENGVKLSVNHFSSDVASDVFDDPEVYEQIKRGLPEIEKTIKELLAEPIQVPDIRKIKMECYDGIPEIVYQQIQEWLNPEFVDVVWCVGFIKLFERHGDEEGVNRARKMWADLTMRLFEKEKAYYEKYHGQADKYAVEEGFLSRPLLMAISSGGEGPPELLAMYEDWVRRKEKWAFESAKYSIDKLKNHYYNYMEYAIKCTEECSYDQKLEKRKEIEKAMTFQFSFTGENTQESLDFEATATLKGEATIIYYFTDNINPTKIKSNGNGFYTGWDKSDEDITDLLLPNAFQFACLIDTSNLCAGAVRLHVDRLNSDRMTFVAEDAPTMTSSGWESATQEALKRYYKEIPGEFIFDFELDSGDAKDDIDVSGEVDANDPYSVEYTLILEHTPQ